MEYIKKLGTKELYNYSPNKGFVELYDFSKSNINQDSREEAVATVASISYGNDAAKNPKKLYKLLEDLGHNSCFEFIRHPFKLEEYNDDCDSKEYENEIINENSYIDYDIQSSLRHGMFYTYEQMSNLGFKKFSGFETGGVGIIHKETIAVFKIKTPLFIRSQYHRHRCQSVIEMSRRFVKPDKVDFEFWYPEGVDNSFKFKLDSLLIEAKNTYKELLKLGYKPEEARSVLPQSLYTTFWAMKDFECARNFYIERYSVHAQEQIREIAEAELKLLYEHQPEFLGQYVHIVGDDKNGFYLNKYLSNNNILLNKFIKKILDIQEFYKDKNINFVYCKTLNNNYFAKFDVKRGLFVGKILKENVTKNNKECGNE